MKQILIISLLMLFSSSVFAVEFYDVSEKETYAKELKKKFKEKHKDGIFTGEDYYIEVTVPYYDYLSKKQKTDKTGLEPLHR